MIGRINHIAIAVPDVAVAARQWQTILGATVSAPQTLPEHGVRIVFVSACQSLQAAGANVLGDGTAKMGAHGNPVLFLHPKDFNGTLIELEQVASTAERSLAE